MGFEFKYPSDWDVDVVQEEANAISLIFASYVDKVTIAVDDLPENTTLQKYLRQYLSGRSLVDYKTLTVNQTQITAEKLPTLKAEYQIGAGPTTFQAISYLTIKNNTAYIMTLFWQVYTAQDHRAGFESIINSFTIL